MKFIPGTLVLQQLEEVLDEPIPQVTEFSSVTFGYILENGKITGLGLYSKGLSDLPETLGHLTNLERLYLIDNKLTVLLPKIRLRYWYLGLEPGYRLVKIPILILLRMMCQRHLRQSGP